MGYHLAIVRTGSADAGIRPNEVTSVLEARLGFELKRDESGVIKQAARNERGEELVLFYDGRELWTKNPSDTAIELMIDVSKALGGGARIRGDEGETYRSLTSTYRHPDDLIVDEEAPGFDWKRLSSLVIPVGIGLAFLYVFGKLLLRSLL